MTMVDVSPGPRPRIELIGPSALIGIDGTRRPLERKAAALLALLALEGPRSRAAVAALLWPGASNAQARNSLRQRLFRLNQAAGAELVTGQEELQLIDAVSIDFAAANDDRLDAEVDAAPGELLEGLDYEDLPALDAWSRAARARWRLRRHARLDERASRHEADQAFGLALRCANRLLDEEPLREDTHRRVIRLHYLLGDRAAALAAFERCRAVLQEELGVSPNRETDVLAEMIRRSASGTASERAQALPVSVLRPPQLIGREAPRALLADAASERGVVLLRGEPGIGKSRMLEEIAAARPLLVASGGRVGDVRVPYALLARIVTLAHARWASSTLPEWAVRELARCVPALGSAPDARLDPLRLRQAFAAALSTWSEAGLEGLVVDDLHHADDASLECLLGVASEGRPRLAWLLGVRSEDMPTALQAWLAGSDSGNVTDIRLGLLDGDDMAALLASLALDDFTPAEWAGPLLRHSGGNPLFALETLRALIALGAKAPRADATRLPVPAALEALLARRLGQRSEAALRLARVAALAGADFDAEVAAAVLGAHLLDIVAPWRELEAAQLLSDGGFSHDLIADAVLRELPGDIARVLHSQLATALAELGRGAARIAPHWAAAAMWDRAGEAFAAAAREARRAFRRIDEVALWERAAESFDRAARPGMAFDARAASVEGVVLTRGVQAAAVLVDRLDADQRSEPQRMRAATSRATVCLMGGRAQDAEAAARLAFDAATRIAAQWPRFEAARLLAVALAQLGRAQEALAAIEPFREFVIREGDLEQRHNFWSDYAYSLKAAQRIHDTADALREALRTAEEAGDHAELATLTSNLALVEGNLGRVEQALEHARRARSLNDPLGIAAGPPAGAIELYVSVHEGALGHYAESLAGFDRARACFAGNPGTVWGGLTANHLAHVLTHLGQFARAGQALQWDGGETPATEARRTLLQHRIDRLLGRRSEHSIDAALERLAGRDTLMRLLLTIESSLSLPADEAAARCSAVCAEAERMGLLGIGLRARLIGLRHRVEAGDLAGAEVADFVARLDGCHPADTYLADTWWAAFRAFDSLGEAPAADAALRRGHAWVAEQARRHVPDAFRSAFLDRNPVNRDMVAAAARRLGLRMPAPVTMQ